MMLGVFHLISIPAAATPASVSSAVRHPLAPVWALTAVLRVTVARTATADSRRTLSATGTRVWSEYQPNVLECGCGGQRTEVLYVASSAHTLDIVAVSVTGVYESLKCAGWLQQLSMTCDGVRICRAPLLLSSAAFLLPRRTAGRWGHHVGGQTQLSRPPRSARATSSGGQRRPQSSEAAPHRRALPTPANARPPIVTPRPHPSPSAHRRRNGTARDPTRFARHSSTSAVPLHTPLLLALAATSVAVASPSPGGCVSDVGCVVHRRW